MSEADIAYGVSGLGRFRANIFQQRGTVGMVLRVIPDKVRSLAELGCRPSWSASPRSSAASCS